MAERNATVPMDKRIELRIGITSAIIVVEDGNICSYCELRISQLTIPVKSDISTVLANAEKFMAISISNFTVSTKAAVGTTIGALTVQDASGAALVSEYTLTKNSAGFFAVSGNNLVTQRGSIPVGNYSVRLHAVATKSRFSGKADFVIAVTP
jgi:hypothetical protein